MTEAKLLRVRAVALTAAYPGDLPRIAAVKLIDDLLRYVDSLENERTNENVNT